MRCGGGIVRLIRSQQHDCVFLDAESQIGMSVLWFSENYEVFGLGSAGNETQSLTIKLE